MILFETTDLYLANKEAEEDTVVDQGGTSSGKTYSIVQCLFSHAYEGPGVVCTIAGQDLPNLRVGAIRDADSIVSDSLPLQALIRKHNKSENTYYLKNGSIVEFKAYQTPQDAKSGKRDYLFVNEANGITYEIFNELYLRTKKKTYLDYNPNSEFWVHEKLIGEQNVKLLISDHRHNPYVPEKIRDKIEALKYKDEELYKVYARGLTGKIEGLIYRNYTIVDDIPEGATFIANGLDFGFTNDPSAFLSVYKQNGELWIDERFYETDLTNPMICDKLFDNGVSSQSEIIADSSEPKSIKEISSGGYLVTPADKGPDSIRIGINILKRYKLNITRRSVGIRKELKTYKYKVDKATGKSLNVPVEFNNHALDALRYVALNKLAANEGSGNYSII